MPTLFQAIAVTGLLMLMWALILFNVGDDDEEDD